MRKVPLYVVLSLLLAACAGPERQLPAAQDWLVHVQQLETFNHWQASGKLALRSPAGSESGNLTWRQAGDNTRIDLSGPLGVAPTRMVSDGRWLDITRDAHTDRFDLNRPRDIAAATGWDFPLQALPYWLKGLPTPDLPLQALEQDVATGGASSLQQADWQVRYEHYARFDGVNLPTRILITNGEVKATVLLRQWRGEQDGQDDG